MSIRMMFRKCRHCGHKYTYNPSIGDMGEFCPRCHMAQRLEMKEEKKNKRILDRSSTGRS